MGMDNPRIYVSGFGEDVTEDDLRELFGGIGVIGRIKQRHGYKDQWPYAIKIYKDEAGKNKGDATIIYEDPGAAAAAPGFFNGHSLKGNTIQVQMATMNPPREPGANRR